MLSNLEFAGDLVKRYMTKVLKVLWCGNVALLERLLRHPATSSPIAALAKPPSPSYAASAMSSGLSVKDSLRKIKSAGPGAALCSSLWGPPQAHLPADLLPLSTIECLPSLLGKVINAKFRQSLFAPPHVLYSNKAT
jgi:hypothetical protein